MKCEYCDNEIPAGAAKCPSCGAPSPLPPAMPQPAVPMPPAYPAPTPNGGPVPMPGAAMPKQRIVYVLLAIFLGSLGIHNFYAGHTASAVIQLLLSVLSCGALAFVSFIWAIIEAVAVEADGNGVPFT